MLDVSFKLKMATRAYKPKDYDGHAHLFVNEARTFNTTSGSLYGSKIKSISSQVIESTHGDIFGKNVGHLASLIKSALRS
jgi:hypothetical protein